MFKIDEDYGCLQKVISNIVWTKDNVLSVVYPMYLREDEIEILDKAVTQVLNELQNHDIISLATTLPEKYLVDKEYEMITVILLKIKERIDNG